MSTSVVFAGQIRDITCFKNTISVLQEARGAGLIDRIVFSTWHEEIERHENLREFLKSSKVLIVTSRMPELLLDYQTTPPAPKYVTILQQMKSVRIGIEACDDNDWIIRLRPDSPLSLRQLRMLSSEEGLSSTSELPGWPKLFSQRIVVVGGLCFHPFFMNDTMYAGLKVDLRRLISPQIFAQLFGLQMNCEQHLFSHLFWEIAPIIPQYFRVNAGPQSVSREVAIGIGRVNFESPFFQKVLTTFYHVLRQYFKVVSADHKVDKEALHYLISSENISFEKFLERVEYDKIADIHWFRPAYTYSFSGTIWLELLIEGAFAPTQLSAELIEAFATTRNLENQSAYSSWMLHTQPDVLKYRDALFEFQPELSHLTLEVPIEGEDEITWIGRPMQASILT